MTPVNIKISSTIDYGTHIDSIEKISVGKRFDRPGQVSLKYGETPDEAGRPVTSIVTIDESIPSVTIHRPGPKESDMIFSPGLVHVFQYATPMGLIPMNIETILLTFDITSSFIIVEIKYELSDRNSSLSKNHLKIVVSNS